jgi:probable HAF family extracellular repeat protein
MGASSFKALVAASIVGGFLLLVAGASGATAWSVSVIGDPGFIPIAVNDAGTVAGYGGSWPNQQAIVWKNGATSVLATPDNVTSAIAGGINSAGVIVGTANLDNGSQEAVKWDSSGQMTELGFLPGGNWSSANDINASGQVVGVANNPGVTSYQAVVWASDGSIQALPPPADLSTNVSSFAIAINSSGQIVGDMGGHAVLWDNGVPTELTPPANALYASSSDINDSGQIVGAYSQLINDTYVIHPVLWGGGNTLDLGALPGENAWANAINNAGQVVGASTDSSNVNHGFIWENSVTTPLDPLSGDIGSWPTDINQNGQIVGGSGDFAHAVMWTQAKSAAQLLADLGTAVQGVGPGTSLADKVKAAQTALAKNDIPGTCSILNAFINQVKAQRGKSILPAKADVLIADAQAIEKLLVC